MRLKVLACQIALREICHAVSRSKNTFDLEFLPYDLHDDPKKGMPRLQERIDGVPEKAFDAILIGFGLCEKILIGVTARSTPLVIPRAHDCMTLFLGSKERYTQIFFDDPRTYYYTGGWVEKNELSEGKLPDQRSLGGLVPSYNEYVEKYGEETAKALMEIMDSWKTQYHRGLYIGFDFTDHLGWREKVMEICKENGWTYSEVPGNPGLLQRWVDGEWEEASFLVVPPGRKVVATFDESIIGLAPVAGHVSSP